MIGIALQELTDFSNGVGGIELTAEAKGLASRAQVFLMDSLGALAPLCEFLPVITE